LMPATKKRIFMPGRAAFGPLKPYRMSGAAA
jgi:hypothetical protein